MSNCRLLFTWQPSVSVLGRPSEFFSASELVGAFADLCWMSFRSRCLNKLPGQRAPLRLGVNFGAGFFKLFRLLFQPDFNRTLAHRLRPTPPESRMRCCSTMK